MGPEGYIYAIGGFGGSDEAKCESLSSVERFNIDRGVWEVIEPMNVK